MGSSDSAELTARVVANTDAETSRLPLESVLSLRPLGRCALWFAVSVCVFGFVLGTAPDWVRTGLYRYIDPFGAVEWPRRVEIVPLTAAESVAMGESVTVRMAVQRGLHDRLRAIVQLREPNGEVSVRTAQRDSDSTFFATIDAVTSDLEYWFEAGDASTAETNRADGSTASHPRATWMDGPSSEEIDRPSTVTGSPICRSIDPEISALSRR